MIANNSQLFVIPQGSLLPNNENPPQLLYSDFNSAKGPNGLQSVSKRILIVNDQVKGLTALMLDNSDPSGAISIKNGTIPIYMSVPLEAGQLINAFSVIMLGASGLASIGLLSLGLLAALMV